MKRIWLSLVVVTMVVFGASTVLADGPAVSGVNGKITVLGGDVDGDSAKIAAGTLSVPLGEKFGLQFDAAYGELDDDIEASGVGVHVFTRDPEQYLLGLVGTYSVIEDVDFERYALEAEYYAGDFSLVGKVGQQQGDIDTDAFGKASLRWYPTTNLMLAVGGSFAGDDDNYAFVGAEAQVYDGLALFVNLATGEDDYDHVLVGARYYFGAEKDLIKRHREDDPGNEVLEGFTETLKEVAEEMESLCPPGYIYTPPEPDAGDCLGEECVLIPRMPVLFVIDPEVPEGCVPETYLIDDFFASH